MLVKLLFIKRKKRQEDDPLKNGHFWFVITQHAITVNLTTLVKINVWLELKNEQIQVLRPTQSTRYLYYDVKQKWYLIKQNQICFAVTLSKVGSAIMILTINDIILSFTNYLTVH